jgi:hypothetical protein
MRAVTRAITRRIARSAACALLALIVSVLIGSTQSVHALTPAPALSRSLQSDYFQSDYFQSDYFLERRPLAVQVRLCNGISKHTRTICCGTHPPAWCGKRPDASDADKITGVVGSALDPSQPQSQFTAILRDPMLYLCMITCVTIIFLAALAASGRDKGKKESV